MTRRYDPTPGGDARGFVFELERTEAGLQLCARHHPRFAPMRIDWTDAAQRRRVAGRRRQQLARAIGLHKRADLHVLDATGGLGRDAWTLAALGARVDMVERQPLIAALLRDAHRRAAANPAHADTASRLQLHEADVATLLAGDGGWDVVHIDPMYPGHDERRALPQKEMQLLREICGDDADAGALLLPARTTCRLRVVVKRPLHAPHLDACAPDFQLAGTQARYDIYLPLTSL